MIKTSERKLKTNNFKNISSNQMAFNESLKENFAEEYESIFDEDEQESHTLTRMGIRLAFSHYLDLSMSESTEMLNIIVDNLFSLIVNCANDSVNKKGKRFVKISKFGTFLIHEKKERLGRNPKNKKEATITPRYSVSFRSSASLRACVNNEEEVAASTKKTTKKRKTK